MNNEFVSYKMALALKELGFNESCFTYYYNLSGKLRTNISVDIDNGWTYFPNKKSITLAPTFSQTFRFFREKYNIQGYIYSSAVRGNAEKTKQFTGYIWNINGIDMPFLSTDARDKLHDTYEEAELACLMKLIEIKNKSV